MFCKNCGFEFEDGVMYCPQCGAQQVSEQAAPQENQYAPVFEAVPENSGSGFAQKITEFVSSGLFLAMTILVTASAAFDVFGNFQKTEAGFKLPVSSIICILLAVFMWMSYASAKKGEVNYRNLRKVSGTIFAYKVILFVVSGLIACVGAILTVADKLILSFLQSNEFLTEFESALESEGMNSDELFGELGGVLGEINVEDVIKIFSSALGIGLIIAAVLVVLYGIFGIGSIHKLVKSTYEGVRDDCPALDKLGACRGWILTIGIVKALQTLGSLGDNNFAVPLASGCFAAACIVAFALLGQLKEVE